MKPTMLRRLVLGPFPDGASERSGASGVQVRKPRQGKSPPGLYSVRTSGERREGRRLDDWDGEGDGGSYK